MEHSFKRRCRVFAAVTASLAFGQTAAPAKCSVEKTDYFGWNAVQIANSWVKLVLVPEIGGRLMQVTFAGHHYLFVNEQLKGQVFAPETSAAQQRWFNYGGDKIWPMPEGSGDERHWPGAVGSVLDTGPFTSQVLSQGETCTVQLTGSPDPFTGQQYTREIGIGADSPQISFHATMKNVSGFPQEWSEQSVSQYDTADPGNPAQPNADFWAFVPANPQSSYPNSYHVRTGQASGPGYDVRDGLFTVHTINAGGEVWIDSPAGWLAVVDGSSRFAMVERFRYQRNADYPGGSTVIFFTSGNRAGQQQSGQTSSEPRRLSTFYMEAEINSPMARLEPGESYSMETEWFPTRMGANLKSATYAGLVGRPFAASALSNGVSITGEFGVFFPGRLQARFYGRRGLPLGTANVRDLVPSELVTLEQAIEAPAGTERISLHLIDRNGLDRGPLGEAPVAQAAAAASVP